MQRTEKILGHSPQRRIHVLQEDIDTSIKRNSSHCMTAGAVKRAVPEASHVSVDLQTIRWSNKAKEERYIYLTPRIAQIALVDFDQGKMPKPFRFTLSAGHTIASLNGHRDKDRDYKRAKAALRTDTPAGKRVTRVGGRSPPTMSGKRREFGLKSFDR